MREPVTSMSGLPGKIPEYIVVEGPMGVGKSSLASRLAKRLNADILFEQPQDNPFLERFYKSRGKVCPAYTAAFPVPACPANEIHEAEGSLSFCRCR